uniref:Uncharacterized protein n=1 Tax=Opuntia streptacantha TaxID=393608 RepID=A0A7C9EKW2_OPUST
MKMGRWALGRIILGLMMRVRIPLGPIRITRSARLAQLASDLDSTTAIRVKSTVQQHTKQALSKGQSLRMDPQPLYLIKSCCFSSWTGFKRRTLTEFLPNQWTQKSFRTTMKLLHTQWILVL